MTDERFTLLGLAQVRSAWFREAARWSTAAALPIELVKTMSVEEVRSRLRSGRAFSALVVDDLVPGLDRDLLEAARDAGCAVVVVDSGRSGRSWTGLGAAAVLHPDFDAATLLQVLQQVAQPVRGEAETATAVSEALAAPAPAGAGAASGRSIVVTGAGGTGASTVAMALAQHAASHSGPGGVVLADLALHADHAVLHGTPDVVPGLSELVEGHRLAQPDPESVRALTWQIAPRGYDLLLGLRRHRDWTALRPRAIGLALEGLRRAYDLVVLDTDADLEGEAETGSADVEERNALARTAVTTADLVVAVGTAELKGLHGLLRVVRDVVEHGVEPDRLLPVVNRAPRNPRARAELARAVGSLAGRGAAGERAPDRPGLGSLPGPVFLGPRRHLDLTIRDVARLPEAWTRPIGAAALGLLDAVGARAARLPQPSLIAPGSLGAWEAEQADGGVRW